MLASAINYRMLRLWYCVICVSFFNRCEVLAKVPSCWVTSLSPPSPPPSEQNVNSYSSRGRFYHVCMYMRVCKILPHPYTDLPGRCLRRLLWSYRPFKVWLESDLWLDWWIYVLGVRKSALYQSQLQQHRMKDSFSNQSWSYFCSFSYRVCYLDCHAFEFNNTGRQKM